MKQLLNEEFLKMQKLAGVITENEYKTKLEELGVIPIMGGLITAKVIASLAMKAYKNYKNNILKKGLKETGNEKKSKDGIVAKEYELNNEKYWGITYQNPTKNSGFEEPRIFLFKPDKIDEVLKADLKWDTSDEEKEANDYNKKFAQFKADKIIML